MKKFNFLKFSIACAMLAAPLFAGAQGMRHFEGNWYQGYVGERVIVTAPANVAGSYIHTVSNEGPNDANKWGGEIISLMNKDVIKCIPYDACGPITNDLTGKVALVKRGDCEFGAKAKAVQDKGAIAIIIVNNVSGGAVGMGAGAVGASVTIPVIMVSDVDGAALEGAVTGGNGLTISLAKWGLGNANDIGFVDGGLALSHAAAMPLHQMKSASSVDAYKMVSGAVIANFGSADQTGVSVKAELKWTPDGGTETIVKTTDIPVGDFHVADSIFSPFKDEVYALPDVTTTGRFDLTYTLTMANTDDFPFDNTIKQSFYVTNNVISKGRWNANEVKPSLSGFYQLGGTGSHMAGNMIYNAKGGYKMEKLHASISNNNPNDESLISFVSLTAVVWKWQDKNNNKIIESSQTEANNEISIVGFGDYQFKQEDSSQSVFPIVLAQENDKNKAFVSEDNTWYWVSVNVPAGCFVGCDGVLNYYPRSYFRTKVGSGSVLEPYASNSEVDYLTLGTSDFANVMFPFEGSDGNTNIDTVRFAFQRRGAVPNIPIYTSVFTAGVNEVVANTMALDMYPNPATDVINVSVNFEKTVNKIVYTVLDATGKEMNKVFHTNVKNEVYQIATDNLPAGNYYLLINADNDQVKAKKFTIVK